MALAGKKKSYRCVYCNKEYDHHQMADACRDSHDLIYIALSKEDLGRLIQYLYTGERELITESMVKNLKKMMRLDKE